MGWVVVEGFLVVLVVKQRCGGGCSGGLGWWWCGSDLATAIGVDMIATVARCRGDGTAAVLVVGLF